jgi:hypothetical protein
MDSLLLSRGNLVEWRISPGAKHDRWLNPSYTETDRTSMDFLSIYIHIFMVFEAKKETLRMEG